MSYLLDKKIKRNKFLKYLLFIIVLLIIIYFKSGIFSGFSYISYTVFRPILVMENNISENFSNTMSFFYSKKALLLENKDLKSNLDKTSNRLSNYNILLNENLKLKEILGRKTEKTNMILASILAKPNQSPYDTLIIDVGTKNGIEKGQKVFALGDIPIGRVSLVYSNSAKVILFSSSGEKTEVIISLGKKILSTESSNNNIDNILGNTTENITGISDVLQNKNSLLPKKVVRNIFSQAVGRGGGNFEIILPRDLKVQKETEVILPGIKPFVLGIVKSFISDPRDSFQKVLLVSPVNIQEIKFVEVETKTE